MYLDWRQIIEEEYSWHILPLLYLCTFEVLRDRVLITKYRLVPYIAVHCRYHLQFSKHSD